MIRNEANFTFRVPEGHEKAGEKITKSFQFDQCETDAEAVQLIADKKWSVKDLANEALKTNARSNAYQNALAPYRPTERTPEQIRQDLIRDFIRSGKSEELATKLVDMALAAENA